MTATSTATETISALYAGFGELMTNGFDFFILIFGVFAGLFAFSLLTKMFVRGIKKVR